MKKFLCLIIIISLMFTCSCTNNKNMYANYAEIAEEFIEKAGIIRSGVVTSAPVGFLHGELLNLDNDKALEMLLISADEKEPASTNSDLFTDNWQCNIVVYDLSEGSLKAQKIFDKTGVFGGNGGPSIFKFEKDGKTVLMIDEMSDRELCTYYFDTSGEKPEIKNYKAECDEWGEIINNTRINDMPVEKSTFLKKYDDVIKKCEPLDCLYMYIDYIYTDDAPLENVSLEKTKAFVKQLSEFSGLQLSLPQK